MHCLLVFWNSTCSELSWGHFVKNMFQTPWATTRFEHSRCDIKLVYTVFPLLIMMILCMQQMFVCTKLARNTTSVFIIWCYQRGSAMQCCRLTSLAVCHQNSITDFKGQQLFLEDGVHVIIYFKNTCSVPQRAFYCWKYTTHPNTLSAGFSDSNYHNRNTNTVLLIPTRLMMIMKITRSFILYSSICKRKVILK